MRRRCVVVLLVLLASAVVVAPAGASHGATFTLSATRGVRGSTVTVTSVTPCPNANGTARVAFGVGVRDGSAVQQELTPAADGSWSTEFTVPTGARNGYAAAVIAICYDPEDLARSFLYDFGTFIVTSAPAEPDPVVRLAGSDRIATAIAVSNDRVRVPQASASVVLARSDTFADTLAGTPLAAHLWGVLLLTPGDQLPAPVADEIRRALAPDGTVYLLGGTAAISGEVEGQVAALGFRVVRLAGTTRHATAVRIAEEIEQRTMGIDRIVLADGASYRQGLLAGSAAASATLEQARQMQEPTGVVLLTDGGRLPDETAAFLGGQPGATRFAIGAPAAAADPSAEAVVGADDAATAVLVAERFFPDIPAVGFASGADFPDALTGGVHARNEVGPLLFTDGAGLPPVVRDFLERRRDLIVIAFLYGGTTAVTPETEAAIGAAIR